MIERSDLWKKVEEKQKELRELINGNWKNGEWDVAETGEKTLKAVEESIISSRDLVQITNLYMETVEKAEQLLEDRGEC